MHRPLALRFFFALVCAAYPTIVSCRPWWMNPTESSSCTEGLEIVCSDDCSQVIVCLGDGEGGFIPYPVANCDVGANITCSASSNACVPAGDSECQQRDQAGGFTCHGIGSFPDPDDCQTFHVCVTLDQDSIVGSCPGNTAYNPLTADCTLTTSDRVCTEGPITPCTEVDQVGVVQENPAIYYICTQKGDELVAEMYRCPGGKIYDVSVSGCVDPSSTTETESSSTSSQTTAVTSWPSSSLPTTTSWPSSSSLTTVTSPPSTTPPTTVTSPPSSASPTTETSSPSSPPTTVTTSPPSSTSPTTVTSPPSSSSPTTVTTLTTPLPTTETPSSSPPTSTPTSPTPTPGGTCTTDLEIVVDPLDCTSYYECVGHKWLHVECIEGYYFDQQENECVEGSC